MNQICAVSKHKSQVLLVLKEYKGCPMLNQTDFSDKLQCQFLSWEVLLPLIIFISHCLDKRLQICVVQTNCYKFMRYILFSNVL